MRLNGKQVGINVEGRWLLRGIDAHVDQGEIVGIIGPNGAGKSTFLNAMAGILPCSEGAVLLDSRDLRSMKPRQRAAAIAYVRQDTAAGTDLMVRDLVMLGRYGRLGRFESPDSKDLAVVARSIELVGIQSLADRGMATLSGGERQLVQLARAIAQEATFLLLDEPTAALDIRHQLGVFSVLRRLRAQETGIALVIHDLNEAARYCDRLLVIADGQLMAQGSPADVLTEELLAQVYGIRAIKYTGPGAHTHIYPIEELSLSAKNSHSLPSTI